MNSLLLLAALSSAAVELHQVLPQIRAQFSFVSMNQEEDVLAQLFRDPDPAVRREAVRAFKGYVGRSTRNREDVLRLAQRDPDAGVRHEAIKTLSGVAGYADVRDFLTRARLPIAYKALYIDAMQRNDTRDHLLDVAMRAGPLELRKAAAWGLFLSGGDPDVRRGLLDLAVRAAEPELRVEALKSLYGSMGYPDVRDTAEDLAVRGNDVSVREAAILLLANRHTTQERDILERLATREPNQRLRRAAVVALGTPRSEEIIAFFHLVRRDTNGVVIGDPLDNE